MISQSRTPAGILRTLTAILCLAAILMSVTGSSAWAAPRVVRVVGIQDGISDSQADYFRRTIAELNDLTEDRIFVTRPIPAASSLDLNAYQGLDFAIVSPRVFALLERYNGFIPMASLSVDIPDCEPGAELRPVVSALVFATPDADEDGLAKPHLSDIAGETVYMSYQKKTLLEEMREHAAWVILAAAILIGMIWHSVAAERLVRRRSAELMETVKRQQASERQFEALERMTAVSQMSNIVAHELRQPLAASPTLRWASGAASPTARSPPTRSNSRSAGSSPRTSARATSSSTCATTPESAAARSPPSTSRR